MALPRVIRRRVAPGGGVVCTPGQTFDGQVAASADDAKQDTDDSVSITIVSIQVDSTTEHGGLRWTNVTVPAGARIDDATLGVYIWSSAGDEPIHQVRGELDANPGTFTTTADDIDSRSRTSATVNWDSTNLGASQNEFWEWGASTAGAGNGADLSSIVQEIVDQGGWASGQAMVMIFEQHTSVGARDLYINAYDQASARAAKLHIEYCA